MATHVPTVTASGASIPEKHRDAGLRIDEKPRR